jgi:hypothetical protein
MPFNTLGVATAVTPSVIETYFSHYLNRSPLKQKPTAHISYHEGLRLIRQFLDYSSKHPVEDLQTFTAQWVPVPTWVRTVDVEVPPQFLTRSANILKNQLRNLDKVGGGKWWQWRRPETPLHAEWIEMKKDFNERNRAGTKCDRVILYIHGGAYYFGSVDVKEIEPEEGDDDAEEWDGIAEDEEMGEAPQLMPAQPKEKAQPEIDDDGFTKVTSKKKR